MDKIGIPRSLFYYYHGHIWEYFFDYLKIKYIVSPKTNEDIIQNGLKYSNDEMCQALKNYIGHINYLQDKCDYIIIPRIDNYKINNQTCTNFLAAYDIVNNIFDINILNYNIDLENNQTLKKGMYNIGKKLNKSKSQIKKAYKSAMVKYIKENKRNITNNLNKLNNKNTKILLVSHPYNTNDIMGDFIIKYLNKNNCSIIYSHLFASSKTHPSALKLSPNLYWKYSKENIGSIVESQDKIDGIIFLSSFPCALDSLVNELVMRKITIPNINIIIDDTASDTGLETRLESFIDILNQRRPI